MSDSLHFLLGVQMMSLKEYSKLRVLNQVQKIFGYNNNKKLTNKNRSEFQKEFAGIIFRLQIKMFYENIAKYAEPDLLSS